MSVRKLTAEFLGTALLVFFAVGTATLVFGFELVGESVAAGVATTSLAFGLVLLALVYAIGPVSGCHVNPAVTLGFVTAGRMSLREALGYWVAQFTGAVLGAAALWAVLSGSPLYRREETGLGTDGWGESSMIGIGASSAFVAEVVLTFLFVLVVLAATSHAASAGFAGLAIGMALTAVHLVGIPLTGTSINPARSVGPALIVGGDALGQVWLFVVAPLAGGAVAALVWRLLIAERPIEAAPGQVLASDIVAR